MFWRMTGLSTASPVSFASSSGSPMCGSCGSRVVVDAAVCCISEVCAEKDVLVLGFGDFGAPVCFVVSQFHCFLGVGSGCGAGLDDQ